MKVILLENLETLGTPGDIVDVKDGYARNFLFPKKIATVADQKNVKRLEQMLKDIRQKQEKAKQEADAFVKKLEAVSYTISVQVGEEKKMFGSVTSIDIEKALKAEGFDIDRKNIQLTDPIKELGIYTVPVKIHNTIANIKVWVVEK